MHMKKVLIGLMFLIMVVIIITACSVTNVQEKPEVKNDSLQEVLKTKIEYYTKNTFRFMNEINIENQDDQTLLYVSLVPEVGSVPIKEDIYKSVASHAVDVIKFFPEITSFKYVILWDDREKKEVMQLTLDEEALKNLNKNYYDQLININGGLKSSFKSVFSSITESGAVEKWTTE